MAGKKAPVRRRPLVDMRGAAEYTGFSVRQLRRWIEQRSLEIPIVKVRNRNWFDQDDLDRFIASRPRILPSTLAPELPKNPRARRK